MTEPAETLNICQFCGGSYPMTRQNTDERFSCICRNCLEKTTTTHTQILEDWGVFGHEMTQDPVQVRDDAETLWARFDIAFSTFNTLVPVMRKMAEGKDPLDYQWDGGPVDKPQRG